MRRGQCPWSEDKLWMNGTVLCANESVMVRSWLIRGDSSENGESDRYTIWNTMFVFDRTTDRKECLQGGRK